MIKNFRSFLPPLFFLLLFGGGLENVRILNSRLSLNPLWAQTDGVPWQATDALGRVTPLNEETGDIRKDRKVGIFYFLWHLSGVPSAPYSDHPYNIAEIFEQDPDILSKPNSPLWGGDGVSHYWGEPLYGYYRSDDPWVLRRHLQLLSDAGIDFLVFDTTNAVTYPEAFLPLCRMLKTLRDEGEKTPQVTFMLNTAADKTANLLWEQIYGTGEFDDLLFHLEGKPLLIGDPKVISNPVLHEKLTLRRAHWPNTMVDTKDAWHWEAAFPQPYGWTKSPNNPEQINVSVAQNLSRADASVSPMSDQKARGRSFCNGQLTPEIATDEGRNFAEQWVRAREIDPPYVMITGWNEWIAGRWPTPQGHVFVDQFDREYSRDIEMMKDGHLDNYYLQMIEEIRRYKGTPARPAAASTKTIDPHGDFGQWEDVGPVLTDHQGETIPRDFDGTGGTHYQNRTGRNDLREMKVSYDRENLYFYLKTAEPIQPEPPNGLVLLLETDGRPETGWLGGDFLIGRVYDDEGVSLEKYRSPKGKEGLWNWRKTKAEKVAWSMKGNELQIAVPLKAIQMSQKSRPLEKISFKWMDNVPEEMTPADLYLTGDIAPESRFFYNLIIKRKK